MLGGRASGSVGTVARMGVSIRRMGVSIRKPANVVGMTQELHIRLARRGQGCDEHTSLPPGCLYLFPASGEPAVRAESSVCRVTFSFSPQLEAGSDEDRKLNLR